MFHFEAALINVLLLWILTVPHEFAHAWVATRLGDDTPRLEGRVTLHPLAHVDWLGTVLLPFITSLVSGGFLGWGKPVNTNPFKLRGGVKGLAMVAVAGPASNLVFSVILALFAVLIARPFPAAAGIATQAVALSIYLALFNLIPVPPLDGSKLLLLVRTPAMVYNELARGGFIIIMVLIMATPLGRWMSMASFTATDTIFRLLPFRF
ncbi:MAG: site-2 protease family protein [Acidobacteriales bacterium]|nr:site-2 protease family protein [Terriglobales bacterium]